MGRPAGVADADRARQRAFADPAFQVDELALGAPPLDPAVHQGRDARRIVAAIFQPLQPFDQQRRCLLPADDSDDAAHESPNPYFSALRSEEHKTELQSLLRSSYVDLCL